MINDWNRITRNLESVRIEAYGTQRTSGCVDDIAAIDVDGIRSASDDGLVLARPQIKNGHQCGVGLIRRRQNCE